MNLYGFEGYGVQFINSRFFNTTYESDLFNNYSRRRSNNPTFRMKENGPAWDILVGYRANAKKLMELPLFKDKHYLPQPGETLYFDKGCTIPRIKCENTWKRTVKIYNADVVVIPEPDVMSSEKYAVFVHHGLSKVFLMRLWNDNPAGLMIGASIRHLIQQAQNTGKISRKYNSPTYRATVDAVADATCIYMGEVIEYIERKQYIFNVIDGLYPRIVYEADLMKMLGSEEEKFDADFLTNMLEMLSSKDRDTVHHGMRILASMDYTHYPSITKFILNETDNNWTSFKPFNSSVKFMLDRIGHYGMPFKGVTAEEFFLAKPIFEEIVKLRVKSSLDALRSQTNIKIDEVFAVDLTLPNPTQVSEEKVEDECPDCPKVDEVDFGFINN